MKNDFFEGFHLGNSVLKITAHDSNDIEITIRKQTYSSTIYLTFDQAIDFCASILTSIAAVKEKGKSCG